MFPRIEREIHVPMPMALSVQVESRFFETVRKRDDANFSCRAAPDRRIDATDSLKRGTIALLQQQCYSIARSLSQLGHASLSIFSVNYTTRARARRCDYSAWRPAGGDAALILIHVA